MNIAETPSNETTTRITQLAPPSAPGLAKQSAATQIVLLARKRVYRVADKAQFTDSVMAGTP